MACPWWTSPCSRCPNWSPTACATRPIASPYADITLSATHSHLVIAVHDRHPYRPKPLARPHKDGSGGRGLLVVQRITNEAHGTLVVVADSDCGGKTITIQLPLR